MKTLDRKASEILRGLLALQKSKIDNSDGTYMPEMIIALHKDSQQFVPYYYRNDYMGIEQYSVRWTDEGILLNRRLQADHTTFANQWLRNIATQQHLL